MNRPRKHSGNVRQRSNADAERAIARDLGVSVDELYRLLAPARGRDQAETAPLVKIGPGGDYVREVR